VKVEDAAPPEDEEELVGDDISIRENRDDADDYIGLVLYEAH
jgi:hypothetical protein